MNEDRTTADDRRTPRGLTRPDLIVLIISVLVILYIVITILVRTFVYGELPPERENQAERAAVSAISERPSPSGPATAAHGDPDGGHAAIIPSTSAGSAGRFLERPLAYRDRAG